ncbi:SMI1/KNR4 family protein [Actinomadura gamaensis]|uniref:SMI1/KNR4 family protein n=1 Tax=Actinomadura gamaensis TaxID=1763541 RepID=A0ABV9U1Q1_9ACTN
MPALDDFATWEPLLRVMRDALGVPVGQATGSISTNGWSTALKPPPTDPERAVRFTPTRATEEAVKPVQAVLGDNTVIDEVAFVADFEASGRVVLRWMASLDVPRTSLGPEGPQELILVDGAVAEPWRRLPEPTPHATPSPTADPALLERTLRERLPEAIPATDAEIAAAEARLGFLLPEELKAVYRVTRGTRWSDFDNDVAAVGRYTDAVRLELYELDDLRIADPESRPDQWRFAAFEAVVTRPDSPVQGLVGSPGWIAFGEDGGGDVYAIDLTPGPAGHTGQVILLSHEKSIGADLIAHSLTDMIVGGQELYLRQPPAGTPQVAYITDRSVPSIEAAAHPDLEVLSLGTGEGDPVSLAALFDCPKLRTLTAAPGTLADPLEIVRLTGLEYLSLPAAYWRVLLDADAVPRSLLAAGFAGFEGYTDDPLGCVEVANRLLDLFTGPPLTQTVVEGVL